MTATRKTQPETKNPKGLYHYTEGGLENVYLRNGFHYEETPYGTTIRIEDIDGLHGAIGDQLVHTPRLLNGKEIRFLRHELGLSQALLARLLRVSEQTVARWEKGHTEVPGPGERLIRQLYAEKTGSRRKLTTLLNAVADLDDAIDRLVLRETAEGWRMAA